MGSGFSVTAGTGIREFEIALRQGLAGTYDFEKAIVGIVNSVPRDVLAESISTGGGCTAVVACDGHTCVALTTMEAETPILCVCRGTAEYPDPMEWLPEQSVAEEYPEGDPTVAELAAAMDRLMRQHLTCETPWSATSWDSMGSWSNQMRTRLFPTKEDAIRWAAEDDAWEGAARVVVEDARTGRNEIHTYTHRDDALAAAGRG